MCYYGIRKFTKSDTVRLDLGITYVIIISATE